MRHIRRFFLLLLTVAILVPGTAIPALANPEGSFLNKINSSRAASGLAPVEAFWDLTDDARAHSLRMSERGSIYHNTALAGVTGVWISLSENVGMGVDINSLHTAFMNSPSHRGNILGNFNYVGVGVKTDSAGVLWVTVVFMKADAGLNGGGTTTVATSQPPAVAAAIPATSVTTTTTQAPAATTTTTQAPPATTTAQLPTHVTLSPLPLVVDDTTPSSMGSRHHFFFFWI